MSADQTGIDEKYEQQICTAYRALREDMEKMGEETCKAVKKRSLGFAVAPVAAGTLLGLLTITISVYCIIFISIGFVVTLFLLILGSELKEEAEKQRRIMAEQAEAAFQRENALQFRQQ